LQMCHACSQCNKKLPSPDHRFLRYFIIYKKRSYYPRKIKSFIQHSGIYLKDRLARARRRRQYWEGNVTKKRTWVAIGFVILISALLVGFLSIQPSAEDLINQTLESMETITDIHAVVEFNLDTPEQQGSATVEIWTRKAEVGPGKFRVEVIETNYDKFAGAIVVSDGETLWAYDPTDNKVIVGTLEEAKKMMEEKDFEMGDLERAYFENPDNTEEAVQMLLEYFTAENAGTETIGNETAYRLKLVPIPEQMPAEFIGVGGFINLWIDKTRSVPLAFEYTGGSFGEVSATVTSLELNTGLEDDLFTFVIPTDVEVMSFADLAPQSISMEEAASSTEFGILTPMETPAGATLVDILEVQGAIIQRYTLPEGGSFTIAQGISEETLPQSFDAESVDVRGVTGTLIVDEDGSRVLLTWVEADLFYSIVGDLTAQQAFIIAESMQ
jgi:outer membrane lipoprotein-sorting protein